MIFAVWAHFRPWLWTAETWAGLQFGVLFLAALVGLNQVREARKLREGSLRPFVIVDIELDDNIELYLSVANIGATLARDVKITFDHPFESATLNGKPGEERPIDRFCRGLAGGIPGLAPGRKIRTLLDLANHRGPREDLRDLYVATIAYTGDVTGKPYAEQASVNVGIHRGRMWVNKKGLHEIHGQVETISKTLDRLSNKGFTVLGRRDRRIRNAEMWADARTRRGPLPLRVFHRVRRRFLRRML